MVYHNVFQLNLSNLVSELGNVDKRSYSESKKSQTGDIATFFPKSAAFDHQEQISQNCNTEKI